MRKALALSLFGLLLAGAFPVYALDISHTGAIDYIDTNAASFFSFGRVSTFGYEELGWQYLPGASHNICTVGVVLGTSGSPTDSVSLELRLASTTQSSGIHLYNKGSFVESAVSQFQVRGPLAEYDFTFSPCAIVVGANQYTWVLKRSGSLSNTDYYTIQIGGTGATYGGTGSWVNIRYPVGGAFAPSLDTASANAADIVLYGTENFGVIEPSTTPSFSESVINQLAGISEDNATSTLTGAAGGWANIPAYYAKRVPWGYAFDIAAAYDNIATSSSDFSDVVFDFSDTNISTGTRGYLPGRLVVFGTSTVTRYLSSNTLGGLNTLAAAVGWVLGMGYWFRRAVKT